MSCFSVVAGLINLQYDLECNRIEMNSRIDRLLENPPLPNFERKEIMTTEELIEKSIENIKAMNLRLEEIAAQPDYFNMETPEILKLRSGLAQEFKRCFMLKEAIAELSKKSSI